MHPGQRLDTVDKALPTDSVLCRGINSLCGPPTQPNFQGEEEDDDEATKSSATKEI